MLKELLEFSKCIREKDFYKYREDSKKGRDISKLSFLVIPLENIKDLYFIVGKEEV